MKALIFDLDGLLSDTEGLHMKSYQLALGEYSVSLKNEEYIDHWITKGKGIEMYLEERKLALDYQAVRKVKAQFYNEFLATDLRPMPFANDIITHFNGKVKMAVATASHYDGAKKVLQLLSLEEYFDEIISGHDVTKSKPAPDIFLRAAEIMQVCPDECIVLEDAEKGVRAAHAAGMTCIAIPNEYTADNDFSLASYRVSSLLEAIDVIDKILVDANDKVCHQAI